ncbi:MAG: hypothetical protein IJ644_01245, partial [Oscillospiraceae bacterium]|nr:hypothetical protein [Oscillospiraceae bacterium]
KAVRLLHKDGTPAYAELHPQGSVLLEPQTDAIAETSLFQQARTPAEYRTIQQKLLSSVRTLRKKRIGEGVSFSNSAYADENTIIGNDCTISENAHLEGCSLGSCVQIGANVNLKD